MVWVRIASLVSFVWTRRILLVFGFRLSEESGDRRSTPERVALGRGARHCAMAGLTSAEKIAGLNPDFQGLLDARGVDSDMQASLFDAGVHSIAMLSAIAVDRDSGGS